MIEIAVSNTLLSRACRETQVLRLLQDMPMSDWAVADWSLASDFI